MVFTSPMDNIKTHKEALVSGGAPGSGPITSWFVCKHIYHTQGVFGFYRGMVARGVATSPAVIAVLVGYQYVKAFASRTNLDEGAS
jgi:hypothetical protein